MLGKKTIQSSTIIISTSFESTYIHIPFIQTSLNIPLIKALISAILDDPCSVKEM